MKLKDKTVLITGSTGGVDRLVARRLSDQGARVLIHGRNRHRGQQVVDQIKAVGRGSAVFLPADFSSLAEVRRLREVNCIPPAILTVIETNMMLALSRSGQVDC
jgi:NAD(P)-dependent dehydrogenase (short-subunit alcohol dehydrogenase family)